MTKIYAKTFAGSELDRERDQALHVRMKALGFVQPSHLDLPESSLEPDALNRAKAQLSKINSYKVSLKPIFWIPSPPSCHFADNYEVWTWTWLWRLSLVSVMWGWLESYGLMISFFGPQWGSIIFCDFVSFPQYFLAMPALIFGYSVDDLGKRAFMIEQIHAASTKSNLIALFDDGNSPAWNLYFTPCLSKSRCSKKLILNPFLLSLQCNSVHWS